MTPRRPLPPAIRSRLTRDGHLLNGLTRRPQQRKCKQCGASILACIHPHHPGKALALDALPVTIKGELLAVLDGLSTWTVFKSSPKMNPPSERNLYVRQYSRGNWDAVIVEHRCGTTHEIDWPTAQQMWPKPVDRTTGPIPF